VRADSGRKKGGGVSIGNEEKKEVEGGVRALRHFELRELAKGTLIFRFGLYDPEGGCTQGKNRSENQRWNKGVKRWQGGRREEGGSLRASDCGSHTGWASGQEGPMERGAEDLTGS